MSVQNNGKADNYSENTSKIRAAQNGDEASTEALIVLNSPLVYKLAGKFTGRGVEYEDLCQLGMIGLLKAIRTFDTERGTMFSTYAVPLILGEIRRFLRDDGTVKIGRKQKRNAAVILRAKNELASIIGYEPGIEDICNFTGMSAEDAVEALGASLPVKSLSVPVSDDESVSLEDTISDEDNIEISVEKIALRESLSRMPKLWRQIVTLRYFKDYSQAKTAELLGLTQVKVSREEKKIFASLRGELVV